MGDDFDFPKEPFDADGGRQFRAKDLDGDRALMFQVSCEVHRGHAALPQFPIYGVPVGQRLRHLLEPLNHHALTGMSRC